MRKTLFWCLAALAATGIWAAAGGASHPPGTAAAMYTLDADFDEGTLLNVNHDSPNNDQLQLNTITEPFPFVNIAASARGTAIRIDVNTGAIIGEFFTAPDGRGRNPSRTTVDQNGSVWVSNRDEFEGGNGSVARIGLIVGGTRANADGSPNPVGDYLAPPFGYSTCVDADGDGLIFTSRGLGDIRPWTNAGGVDNDGGVDTAADECLINYTRVNGTGTRTVAVDANNDLWTGGVDRDHEKLDGVSGAPVAGTQFNLGCGGYGGLVDGAGTLWSARFGNGLLRYVPSSGVGTCFGFSRGDYGLGIDPNTGHVWHSSLSGNAQGLRLYELDGAGNVVNSYPQPFGAQGVAVDGNSHVWMAEIFGSRVWHLAPDPAVPGTHVAVGVVTGLQGVTGVAVDANGKIWAAEISGNRASRIDPAAGPVGGGGYTVGAIDLSVSLGPGAGPYNYSDMTGFVSIGATSPSGTWTVVRDGGAAGTDWGTITWNTEPEGATPGDSSIGVEARASDSQAGLAGETFIPVSNGVEFALVGRYIEIRATLTAASDGTSPVLSDLTVEGGAEADVSIDKIGPVEVTEDDVFSYTLAVSNGGPDDATNVEVTDTLPAGVTYVSSSASQGSCSQLAGTVTCSLGDIASGGSATVTITVMASGEGPYVNSASASAEEDDPDPGDNSDTITTTLNHDPTCNATASGPSMWPPNHKLRSFTLGGATDPDGDPVSITITGVTQDEPVDAVGNGDGNTSPDAFITGSNTVDLRAERAGTGDGRVYRIAYTGSDGSGGSCSGVATVGVPHDQGGQPIPIDSAPPSYNSLLP